MAESLVVSGLVTKRSEIAGLVADYQNKIDRLRVDLEHLDATIKVFNPDYDLRTLPVKAVRARNQYFRPGECQRLVLDVMRETAQAVGSRQIAVEIVRRKGMEDSVAMIEAVQKAVLGSIKGLEARGTVALAEEMDGAGRTWRIV